MATHPDNVRAGMEPAILLGGEHDRSTVYFVLSGLSDESPNYRARVYVVPQLQSSDEVKREAAKILAAKLRRLATLVDQIGERLP